MATHDAKRHMLLFIYFYLLICFCDLSEDVYAIQSATDSWLQRSSFPHKIFLDDLLAS